MGNKPKQFRECEECGEIIESGNPTARLCKRCAPKFQRNKDEARRRPKEERKKKRKKSPDDDFYEEEYDY